MSIEQLQSDIKDNIKSLGQMGALTTAPEIVAHLQNYLWPTIEMIAEEMVELDGCVEDLMNGSEDILQPETGARFLTCFSSAILIAQELRARVAGDPKQLAALGEFDRLVNDCIATVQEITIPDGDALEGDEDDEDDEDEDEEEAE